MKNIFLLLSSILFFSTLHGQILEGTIKTENSEPIAYVNIGIIGKGVGTVSSESGAFNLTIPEDKNYQTDTIAISFIGFETKKYSVAQFTKLLSGEKKTIILKKSTEVLDDIVIRPKMFKQKLLGNKTKGKGVQVGFKENKLGYEIGTLMKIKKSPSFIDSVAFNVASNKYDSVFFRLNIYEVLDTTVGKNILKSPIYISYTKEEIKETIVVDLSKYNIEVTTDFVVTLEFVKQLGEGGFNFSGALVGNPTYVRLTSHGEWEKAFFGIGISTHVTFER